MHVSWKKLNLSRQQISRLLSLLLIVRNSEITNAPRVFVLARLSGELYGSVNKSQRIIWPSGPPARSFEEPIHGFYLEPNLTHNQTPSASVKMCSELSEKENGKQSENVRIHVLLSY